MNAVLLDGDGQPLNRGYNWRRNFEKATGQLAGIVRGMLSDGVLQPAEITFLATWLADNPEVASQWPGTVIADRVRAVLADGQITAAEAEHLQATLAELIGGTVEHTGATSGLATRLPVDACHEITWAARSFCFTGKFVLGPRDKCEALVKALGGIPASTVTGSLNYLIIGALASTDWIHTSYGRKIEKAVELKRKGKPIVILAEERWTELLPSSTAS